MHYNAKLIVNVFYNLTYDLLYQVPTFKNNRNSSLLKTEVIKSIN